MEIPMGYHFTGGRFGGWVLYMKGGKPHHEYNFFGLEWTNIGSSKALGLANI
jgi:hypothetical protein